MRRHLLTLALLAVVPLTGQETTRFVPATASQLVLEGSSNVADWRCSGRTLEGRMEVAAPLDRINAVIDRIEDGDVARLRLLPGGPAFPAPTFQLRIPVDTLRCGNRQMERDMYRALRGDEHPAIEFRFAELVGGVNHDIDAGSYHARISGVVTLAGTKKHVTVEVKAERVAPDRFRLRARLPLRMTDFRIEPPTALFGIVKAKDHVAVEFDLILKARGDGSRS